MINNPDSPFASVIGLGAFKAVYAKDGRGRWFNVIFGAACLLAVPALLLVAGYVGYSTLNDSGLYRVAGAVAVPLVGAVSALVIGAAVLYNTWSNWSLTAALYENGVAYQSRKGLQQVAWSDVAGVWQRVTKHYTNGVYTGTTHTYTIQTNNGEKIVLDDRLGKTVEELGNAVQRGASNTLFPRYWQSLQNGQRLTFGPLALDREKLYSGKKELRWNEIKAVKINKGVISIRKDDKSWFSWSTASVPQIPNFFIFYELVGRFSKIE
jgi:hypothetical protein